MADEGTIVEVVGVRGNKIVPNKLSQAQHAGTETDQLTHGFIQQGTAGCGPAGTCQQAILIGPVHADKANNREDDDTGLHIDVETGKVEQIDKVDILHSQLYLGVFVHLIQLLLAQLDFLLYIIKILHGLLLYQILNCVMRQGMSISLRIGAKKAAVMPRQKTSSTNPSVRNMLFSM